MQKLHVGQSVVGVYFVEYCNYNPNAPTYKITKITSEGVFVEHVDSNGTLTKFPNPYPMSLFAPDPRVTEFFPEPGDTIVCRNGEEFTCCSKENFKYQDRLEDVIHTELGCNGSFMTWNNYEGKAEYDSSYDIVKVIPKQLCAKQGAEVNAYSLEQIVEAVQELTTRTEYSTSYLIEKVKKLLDKKSDPEYITYQRLKAKFKE